MTVTTQSGDSLTTVANRGPAEAMVTVGLNAITDVTPNHGARIYLRELATALAANRAVELRVFIHSSQKEKLPEALQSCAVPVSVPVGRSYWQVVYANRISRAVRDAHCSVYHLPNTLPLASKPGPTVVTIHDLADLRMRVYGRLRTWYRWLSNYLSAHAADQIITVSESSKRDIQELLRVPADKISVVHNAVSREFRPLQRELCRQWVAERHGIRGEFVLVPGGLGRNKNIENTLAAFAETLRSGINLTLALTGDAKPPRLRQLRRVISQLQLEGRVCMTGYLTTADMVQMYNACSLVVYASQYEGFGLPVLESMACGAPLVASSNSSIPEIAGNAAVLVDPGDRQAIADAMVRVLSDEQLRSDLILRGLERARAFTWEKTASETVEVYRQAVNRFDSAQRR